MAYCFDAIRGQRFRAKGIIAIVRASITKTSAKIVTFDERRSRHPTMVAINIEPFSKRPVCYKTYDYSLCERQCVLIHILF